jgi:hypothetical protein
MTIEYNGILLEEVTVERITVTTDNDSNERVSVTVTGIIS